MKVAFAANKHDTIGIDLVAMCVNDLVVQGAEPLFFLDYFATSKLDVDVASLVIKSISQGCKQAGCALIGGETAEMPGMYSIGHYDLAGFAVGAAERSLILPLKTINKDDVVLGIGSSGVHSNGYSLVRHIIEKENLQYDSKAPFAQEKTLGTALLEPTKIYVKSCLAIKNIVKAFAHITGGGLLENIPRVLPNNLAVEIDCKTWNFLPVFSWLKNLANIDALECLRTFNCGIGMVVVLDKNNAKQAIEKLTEQGEEVFTIGRVIERTGHGVEFTNLDSLK